jgi:cytochrome c-type biogenesis protein CcsB
MAELSNQLLPVAVLLYLAAMMCHLVEYAFGRQGAVARVMARPAPARTLVGVGASGPVAGDLETVAPAAPPSRPVGPSRRGPTIAPGRAAVVGRIAIAITVLGVLAHAGVLITRGLAVGRVPWGNMYEFVITVCLVGAITWLVLLARRPALRQLGLFVTTALTLILGFAGMVLYTKAAPLVPALNSYWLKIHVSAAATASGLLLVAFVPAALFLIRSGFDAGRRRFPYSMGARLPEAESLERLSFRLHVFAFPIWTFAIICGAIWAETAWGRYWGWDPKEVWSFISWVAYAAYLHARATPSVKKTTATWFAVAAWGTMLINLYVINFVAVGLHSYAHVGN